MRIPLSISIVRLTARFITICCSFVIFIVFFDLSCEGKKSPALHLTEYSILLNSFENRVYQVGVEGKSPLIAKFYRPGRWSEKSIGEEHAFALELAQREIPVVAPTRMNHNTLHEHAGFRFAVYPRCAGRAPDLENPDTLQWIGRFLGRIHAVGAITHFTTRGHIDLNTFGLEPKRWLLAHRFIPADLLASWTSTVEQVLTGVERCFERAGNIRKIRLHGDCHAGNILWKEEGEERGPHFVDLDRKSTRLNSSHT